MLQHSFNKDRAQFDKKSGKDCHNPSQSAMFYLTQKPVQRGLNRAIHNMKFLLYSLAVCVIAFYPATGCHSPSNETPEDKTAPVAVSSPNLKKPNDMVLDPAAGLINRRFVNSINMTFVYIPHGSFLMGSPVNEAGRYDHETLHQVHLTRGFYLQTTETTQQQWKKVMHSQPSFFTDCPECPVENVSWNDVNRFIQILNRMERVYNKYRLPTEAEWEYACRAGTQTPFYWGVEPNCKLANYGVSVFLKMCQGINPGRTMKTGSFPPNPYGLYDMHGNVAEWCQDRFGDYPREPVTDPLGPYSHTKRVYRGGSWQVSAAFCRSANRDGDFPVYRFKDVGFRLAMTP